MTPRGAKTSATLSPTLSGRSTRGQVASGTQVVLPRGKMFNAADVRGEMAGVKGLEAFSSVSVPAGEAKQEADLEVVEL